MDPGGGESDRASCASERVYRALLRAYPQEVRRRYAEEMVGYFGDLCREERRGRGHMGVALLWARTLPDLLFTALKERSTLVQGGEVVGTKQRIAGLVLMLSDVLLALAVWGSAILIRDAWGNNGVSDTTIAGVLPNVAVWVVLRTVLGLYPGYGINAVDELRRQSELRRQGYATLGAFTMASTFLVFQQVHDVSRFVLLAGFLTLLIAAPLWRRLVKRRLKKARLWGERYDHG